MVPGQPEHQVENGRGAVDGKLKQSGYGRSGMLYMRGASSRSLIWSQVQNGVLCARSDNTKTERCRTGYALMISS
jgi:hypothetical protein